MPGITRYTTMSRRGLLHTAGGLGLAAGALRGAPALAQSRAITVIADQSNAETRAIFAEIAAAYEADTGVSVTVNNMDHEAHKTAIRSYLAASPPDVCFWFSGNRMRAFVERGLFDDISDLFERENYYDVLGTSTETVSVGDRQFGLPLGGTLWGLFYRKDVFAEQGMTPPADWDGLLATCEQARGAGLTPMTLGTKELWPAAGWFDHLNLRINGLDRHMALMRGEMSYLDPSLQPVFDHWQDLIEREIFTPNHTSYSWQQAASFFVRKQSAMFVLGNFMTRAFPAEEKDQLAFVPFPRIGPETRRYEEFSVNSVHIPARAQNKDVAREFLAYFYRPENLGRFLRPDGNVPPRHDIPVPDDPMMRSLVEALRNADGTAQFYDRDTDPDMAQVGLRSFQEFMVAPDRRDTILERMEAARKRVFRA
ncbi:ABC transporter substrate-binding protein [Marinivivus vitaminiproducens]|uniref:ABC transporter substrate-binding protein n=1 Tax=Marinivivus vitaminiproducens TaxID=3035935 RepID=UPI00279C37B3|nr:ABC transporter substrate-binding protein [Geminicoccaceae bacterium SCSIO 64248]